MNTLESTVSLLRDLVAFPTVSSESNLDLIEYVAGYLADLGARVQVLRDDDGAKANLFATLGPDGDGGIVLSGHTDVVPVTDQAWNSDPFELLQHDGRLYGRGTCDMKGFIAATLAMAPGFARTTLARPLHFAFTHDEEVGCLGAQALIEELTRREIRPAVAIIGEPTQMGIIEGHKGCYEYTVDFTGLDGHASVPGQGVNAVEYAVRYVGHLMGLQDELCRRAPPGCRFEPPWTTMQVGRIAGGIARNVIPGHCTVDWEMRPVQRDDGEFVKREMASYVDTALRPAMRAVSPHADVVTTTIAEVEGFEPVDDSEAVRIVSELTGANGADVVSFGTEAGLFQGLGVSTVVCGPGSIEQAHKPDEFVSLEQLRQALRMLERLLPKLTSR
jgi:acetylornithine deacetylase